MSNSNTLVQTSSAVTGVNGLNQTIAHIVMSYNALTGIGLVYINGTLQSSSTINNVGGNWNSQSSPYYTLNIGCNNESPWPYFPAGSFIGSIQLLAIFNYPLNATQVLNWYQNGTSSLV